jgi:hypothetical protein
MDKVQFVPLFVKKELPVKQLNVEKGYNISATLLKGSEQKFGGVTLIQLFMFRIYTRILKTWLNPV